MPFTEKIFQMDFEQVFRIPTIENDNTPALRKRKREKRREAFEVIKLAAYARVRSMEEEVTAEVEARFELHRARQGDIDVEHLLRTGASGPSGTASSQASTSSRSFNYKPQESFLGSKKFPWWRSGDTNAAPDDLEKVSTIIFILEAHSQI